MIIYSFDCAIKNLGFCCIEIDDNWRHKTSKLLDKITNFYTNIPDNKDLLINNILEILKTADNIISNILTIKYINVFDLIPNTTTKKQKFSEILKRLKYTIYCLENQLPSPDIVLIEYQMNINDKARGISRYIEEHFTPLGVDEYSESPQITYAIKKFPLIPLELPKKQLNCLVHIVGPSLKNAYPIDISEAGEYMVFLDKYFKSYDANKAHAVHHFKHYLKKFGLLDIIEDCPNKLDDLSDSFMMAYAWCKKNNII